MTTEKKYTVAIIGARGYVGHELIRLTSLHPNLELVAVSSRQAAGKLVSEQVAECQNRELKFENLDAHAVGQLNVDAVFLALPNGLCDEYANAISANSANTVIIDMSFDQRLPKADKETWSYGLSEINADTIKGASKISNPGCYATAAQLALFPLRELLTSTPSVFGVSGYSGAGSTPSDKNNPEVLKDNLLPYKLTGHLHESEISHHLGHSVNFMPHVAPHFRGLSVTVNADLDRTIDVDELRQTYEDFYKNDDLVSVTDSIPTVQNIAHQNGAEIGGFSVDERNSKNVRVVCVIDNLLKGAATQAMQNLNLALNLPMNFTLTN